MHDAGIMIIAGEASGDMHGANMVAAMKQINPELTFCGIGGSELLKQGMEPLYDASQIAVVGLSEVFSHLKDIRQAMRNIDDRLRRQHPRLLILIDFPDFNLMTAKKAKRYDIPVFYYISPQVWAWRSGRVKKIARLVDKMAVILPFEKDFYHDKGVEVEFVGHPLMDTVRPAMAKEDFLAKHAITPSGKVVGILPGSRKKEISAMLPTFLEVAKMLAADLPDLTFVCPLAPTLTLKDLQQNGLDTTQLNIKVISGDRYDLMAACDAVMAVSGTVTLELAILNVPMVVAYRVSPLTYFLGRRLIKVKYASLVNLVAGKEVVPEMLQHAMTSENIYRHLLQLLTQEKKYKEMRQELLKVVKKLGGAGASQRAAQLALSMIR